MDLPTCPACGQSVLDDDAEDCPFCGASMKTGAPGKQAAPAAVAAKSAPRPAPSRPAPEKPASPEPRSKPAAEGPRTKVRSPFDEDDDDLPPVTTEDPFAVDTSAAKDAIPLRPSPVKGQTLKLVCPMCETPGYTSPKSAGRQVKCANPKCLVPIFTAPVPKVEKPAPPPPPPPKPKLTPAVLVGGSLALFAALGGLGWSLGWFAPKPQASIGGIDPNLVREKEPPANPTISVPAPEDKHPQPGEAAAGASLADLKKHALEQMVVHARADQSERGKAICRRLAADSYVRAGDVAEARNQLTQLVRVAPNISFYQMAPLTEIAWEALRQGRPDDALAAAQQASKEEKSLPSGREPLLIALDLVAVMAALGRAEDAENLVRQSTASDAAAVGVLTTPLAQAWADGSYDLDAAAARDPALPWTAPHRVAVAKILAARGQWDAALAWSRATSDAEGKTECLVAWAEQAAAHAAASKDAKVLEPLASAAAELSPAGRARLWAAVALRQAAAGQDQTADASIQAAKASLAGVDAPAPFALPAVKDTSDAEPPDPTPFRMAAQAAAEIARAEALRNRLDDAVKSLDTAVAHTRGIGPALPAIRERLAASDGAVRSQLKRELKLTSDEAVRRAFNSYRRQGNKLQDAAAYRLDLQARLLASVVDTPLRDVVAARLEQSRKPSEGDAADPLRETSLPWSLVEAYQNAGDKQKAAALKQTAEAAGSKPGPQDALRLATQELLAAGKWDECAAAIENSEAEKSWKERWTLAMCCRLTRQGNFDGAVQFIRAIRKDSHMAILREEALDMTGALASRMGQGKKVREAAQAKGLTPAERVSLLHGFLLGAPAEEKDSQAVAK